MPRFEVRDCKIQQQLRPAWILPRKFRIKSGRLAALPARSSSDATLERIGRLRRREHRNQKSDRQLTCETNISDREHPNPDMLSRWWRQRATKQSKAEVFSPPAS
jgi:hypothetical protein